MGKWRPVGAVPILGLSVRLVLALALLVIFQGVLPSLPVGAATTRLVNVDPVDDNQPGAGCTLREAITVANLLRGPGTDLLTGCKISESGIGPPFFYTLNLPSYKYRLTGAAGEDNNATGDLDIKSNVTLRGMGVDKTVIDGNSLDRVLHIAPPPSSGYVVNLEGLAIRDGGVAGRGGGIYHQAGVLNISKCRLSGNAAGGGVGGGALAIDSGAVEIANSTLMGNRADFGGAIHNGAGSLTIISSNLSDNRATGGVGGAIRSAGTLVIQDSDILGNDAAGSGGGIFNSGSLEISTSTIAGNESAMTTDGGGGGIYHTGGVDVSLFRVTISGNHTTRPGSGVYPSGGGLFIHSGTVDIDGCTFAQNESDWEAGGVHVDGGTVIIRDTEIVSNTAYTYGGLKNESGGFLALYSCTISGNEAVSTGGLYNGGQLTIGHSTIASNRATMGDVGGINVGGNGFLTMYKSTVAHNEAARDAGGLYARDNALVRLTNCTLSGNRAGRHGGALHNTSVDTGSRLSFVTVVGNEADSDGDGQGDGGGIVQNAGEVRVKNSLLAGNVDPGGEATDCEGTLTVHGDNLVQDTAGCTLAGAAGTLSGIHPWIAGLTDNGGATLTHALAMGSPAVDAVADCTDLDGDPVASDQRDVDRPQGGACDIGAFEWEPGPVYLPLVVK
jgi:CSLREA domain-containing protein